MIGDMHCRYSVRARPTTRDARGERPSADQYVEKFEVWGEDLREGSTSLTSEVGGARSELTYRLRVSWRPNIEIGDQLVEKVNGSVYYVMSVTPVGRGRQQLQLVVTQSPSEGS